MNALQFRKAKIQFGKSVIHSWGVFALEEVAAEEVEYIGEYIVEAEANRREKGTDPTFVLSITHKVFRTWMINALKSGDSCNDMLGYSMHCDPDLPGSSSSSHIHAMIQNSYLSLLHFQNFHLTNMMSSSSS